MIEVDCYFTAGQAAQKVALTDAANQLSFTAGQAAQKIKNPAYCSGVIFTAGQAAQKSVIRPTRSQRDFTAGQAAQKLVSGKLGYEAHFTAGQAAQKLPFILASRRASLYCRIGSLEKIGPTVIAITESLLPDRQLRKKKESL